MIYRDRGIAPGRLYAVLCAITEQDRPMHGEPNILYHGPDGYVAACGKCGRFQVAFGTTAMNLEQAALIRLAEALARDVSEFAGRVDPRMKVFQHHAGWDDVRLVLNYGEMERLHRMLSDAVWMHRIYEGVRP